MDVGLLVLLAAFLLLGAWALYGTQAGEQYGWVKYGGRSVGGPIWFILFAVGIGIVFLVVFLARA